MISSRSCFSTFKFQIRKVEGGCLLNDSIENIFFRVPNSEGRRRKAERWNVSWISSSHLVLLVPIFRSRKAEMIDSMQKEVFVVTEGICEGKNDCYNGF